MANVCAQHGGVRTISKLAAFFGVEICPVEHYTIPTYTNNIYNDVALSGVQKGDGTVAVKEASLQPSTSTYHFSVLEF